MSVQLDNVKGITYHKLNGTKYITLLDLELLSGLNPGTMRNWKKRGKMKEGIDYIKLDRRLLVDINSKFIKYEANHGTRSFTIHLPTKEAESKGAKPIIVRGIKKKRVWED